MYYVLYFKVWIKSFVVVVKFSEGAQLFLPQISIIHWIAGSSDFIWTTSTLALSFYNCWLTIDTSPPQNKIFSRLDKIWRPPEQDTGLFEDSRRLQTNETKLSFTLIVFKNMVTMWNGKLMYIQKYHAVNDETDKKVGDRLIGHLSWDTEDKIYFSFN